MKAITSLAGLPDWQQIAGVVQESLTSLSLLQTQVQWLIVDRHDEAGHVLLCSGQGPFGAGDGIDWPLQEVPQPCHDGQLLGFPLQAGDGALEGYFALWLPPGYGAPQAADLFLMRAKASLFATLLSHLHRSQQLVEALEASRRDAETDALTGLLNRRGWDLMLAREQARCIRYGCPCTLLVLDMDGLKSINDADGHHAGDELLLAMAQVLGETVRQPDIVARVGGDEFAVLLTETDADQAGGFLQRLRLALNARQIRTSVGQATWNRAETLAETLRRADRAMYQEKHGRSDA